MSVMVFLSSVLLPSHLHWPHLMAPRCSMLFVMKYACAVSNSTFILFSTGPVRFSLSRWLVHSPVLHIRDRSRHTPIWNFLLVFHRPSAMKSTLCNLKRLIIPHMMVFALVGWFHRCKTIQGGSQPSSATSASNSRYVPYFRTDPVHV